MCADLSLLSGGLFTLHLFCCVDHKFDVHRVVCKLCNSLFAV